MEVTLEDAKLADSNRHETAPDEMNEVDNDSPADSANHFSDDTVEASGGCRYCSFDDIVVARGYNLVGFLTC